MVNPSLLALAKEAVAQEAMLDKTSFVDPGMAMGGAMPPAGGAMPPMDPAAMGGAMPPMDPAAMGGAMPPMDPAAMGGAMPPAAGAPMAGPMPAMPAMSPEQIASMLGGGQPAAGGEAAAPADAGGDISSRLTAIEQQLQQLAGNSSGSGGAAGSGPKKVKFDPSVLNDQLTVLNKVVMRIADAMNINVPASELLTQQAGPDQSAETPAEPAARPAESAIKPIETITGAAPATEAEQKQAAALLSGFVVPKTESTPEGLVSTARRLRELMSR